MVKGRALASSHPTGTQGVVPEKVTEMWNLLCEKAGSFLWLAWILEPDGLGSNT